MPDVYYLLFSCGSKIGPSDEEDVKDEEEGGKVKDTEDHRVCINVTQLGQG